MSDDDSTADRPRRDDEPRRPRREGSDGRPPGSDRLSGDRRGARTDRASGDRSRRGDDAPRHRDGGGQQRRDGGSAPRSGGYAAPRRDGGAPQRRDGGFAPRRDGAAPQRRDGGASRRDGSGASRGGDAPRWGGSSSGRDGAPRRAGGAGSDARGDAPRRDRGAPQRRFDAPRGAGGDRGRGDLDRRAARTGGRPATRSNEPEQLGPRHDDPQLPDDIEAKMLDKGARADLKTLSKDNADGVAKHLIMAGRLIDEDPTLAHRHALAAARRAGRVAVVRETVAITAYATGDFALALRELRTYRRLSGSNDQLALMVDSERGVGRPERALELGRSVPRAELDVPVQVGLAIAMSGARLDLGQADLALQELEIPQLDPARAFSWSPMLFDAYAAVLEELGRADDAARWRALAETAEEALEPEDEDVVEVIEEELDAVQSADAGPVETAEQLGDDEELGAGGAAAEEPIGDPDAREDDGARED